MKYEKILQEVSNNVYKKIEKFFNENNVNGTLSLKCIKSRCGIDYDYCKSLTHDFEMTDLCITRIVKPYKDTCGLRVYFDDGSFKWLDEFDAGTLVRLYDEIKKLFED